MHHDQYAYSQTAGTLHAISWYITRRITIHHTRYSRTWHAAFWYIRRPTLIHLTSHLDFISSWFMLIHQAPHSDTSHAPSWCIQTHHLDTFPCFCISNIGRPILVHQTPHFDTSDAPSWYIWRGRGLGGRTQSGCFPSRIAPPLTILRPSPLSGKRLHFSYIRRWKYWP